MRPTWPIRLGIAGMFLALSWIHAQINSPDDWPFYYVSASLLDAIAVLTLGQFKQSPLIDDLININFTSVIVQGVGCFMYFGYMAPTGYNAMIYTLIIIQWLRLLWVGPDEGHLVDGARFGMVHNLNRLCR